MKSFSNIRLSYIQRKIKLFVPRLLIEKKSKKKKKKWWSKLVLELIGLRRGLVTFRNAWRGGDSCCFFILRRILWAICRKRRALSTRRRRGWFAWRRRRRRAWLARRRRRGLFRRRLIQFEDIQFLRNLLLKFNSFLFINQIDNFFDLFLVQFDMFMTDQFYHLKSPENTNYFLFLFLFYFFLF